MFIDYYNVASRLQSFFDVADKCDMPLGLEDDRVPDPKLRASSSASFYCAARNARLHQRRAGRNGGAWCARVSNRKQWLQVDFGTATVVTKVCTQGRQNSDQWVTSYYLSFSSRGHKFVSYKEGRQTKVDWKTVALCVPVQTSFTLLLCCVRLSFNHLFLPPPAVMLGSLLNQFWEWVSFQVDDDCRECDI